MKYPPQKYRGNRVTSIYSPQGATLSKIELLLDTYPGARFAYSLRELNSNYFGPCIKVKRTSDNTELDIGFSSGKLDVGALMAFVGMSDGLVSIIYDQSGNGFDLDAQTNDNRLPRIIIEGMLKTSNGVPALFFDGAGDNSYSTNGLPSPINQLFLFGVWAKTDILNDPVIFNLRSGSPGNSQIIAIAPASDGTIVWNAGNDSTESLITPSNNFNDLLQHQYTFTEIAGTDNQTIRRDGTQLAQKTQVEPTTSPNLINIGANGPAGVAGAIMLWQELIFYDTDVQNFIIPIEQNMDDYWMLKTLVVTESGEQIVTDTGEEIVAF